MEGAVSRVGRTAIESSRTSVGSGVSFIAADVLPQAIKEFRTHRPDLRIQSLELGTCSIVPMVESGKVDIGLRVYQAPSRPSAYAVISLLPDGSSYG